MYTLAPTWKAKDISTYTGVHANGGPDAVAKGTSQNQHNLPTGNEQHDTSKVERFCSAREFKLVSTQGRRLCHYANVSDGP